MKAFYIIAFATSLLTGSFSYAQMTYTFTNAGATGKDGPTQAQLDAAYTGTFLAGQVTSNLGIQEWTVPSSGSYKIEARGAQGAGIEGGRGASMIGEFLLNGGDVIQVLVGQQGESFGSDMNIGGGGGSFVYNLTTGSILVIAGGGGASRAVYANTDGTSAIDGQDGAFSGATVQGAGGINGQGGGGASCRGGGGAGWLSDGAVGGCGGAAGNGGITFLAGGNGGAVLASTGAEGGFGGGGSSEGTNSAWTYAGGGGGYSGGGGASEANTTARAGGGGSYNSGTNQVNSTGVQTGHGTVIITSLYSAPNDAGVSSIDSPAFQTESCVGDSAVVVTIKNYGSNMVNGVTVNWSVNGVLQTPVAYTTPLDTFGGTGNSSASVALGTVSITGPTSILAWTTLPNGVSDTVNLNDTASISASNIYNPQLDLGPDVGLCNGALLLGNYDTNQYDTYTWSNGSAAPFISVTATGTYSLTVTQGPCPSVDTIEVYQGTLPVINLDENIASCGPMTLDAGNSGSEISWSTGETTSEIDVNTSGSYEVTITNSDGCTEIAEINIEINPVPDFDLGSNTSLCVDMGEATMLSAPNGFEEYLWSTGAETNWIFVGAPTTLTGSQTYIVTVTNEFGCSSSDEIVVDFKTCFPAGLDEISAATFKYYPTPTEGVLTVEFTAASPSVEVSLFDISGRKVLDIYTGAVQANLKLQTDLGSLSAGVYQLRMTAEGIAQRSAPVIIK